MKITLNTTKAPKSFGSEYVQKQALRRENSELRIKLRDAYNEISRLKDENFELKSKLDRYTESHAYIRDKIRRDKNRI